MIGSLKTIIYSKYTHVGSEDLSQSVSVLPVPIGIRRQCYSSKRFSDCISVTSFTRGACDAVFAVSIGST